MADPQDVYRSKLKTAEEAAALIPDGALIAQGNAIGEPQAMLEAIAQRARGGGFGDGITMMALLPMAGSARTILAPEVRGIIKWQSLFASGADRDLLKSGDASFVPAFFHQIPRLYSEFMDIDVAIVVVSPVDKHGYMSLGVSIDIGVAAIAKAKYVVVEVNSHMPRVHGTGWVHVSEIDAIVEHNTPLAELPVPKDREEDKAMSELISAMIPNGACIQLGIGGIPSAVAKSLLGHKDLGIHTEMFVDPMVELIESGVANGSKKTFHPGKAIYTFAAGSQRMYDFVDDNPHIEAHPVSYVNYPPNIAKNDNLVSVNSTIEIDLTGQCCSESMGPVQWSGTGGQHDYARGAFDSKGGKSIIAFYSTAKSGQVSRVVPLLTPGAIVTTPRTEVHWLVSEYGAENLKGKTVSQRARAIIGLAHPKFRDELIAAAKELNYF